MLTVQMELISPTTYIDNKWSFHYSHQPLIS